MNLLKLDLQKKIALAVSAAALAVLVTVGVLCNRSSDSTEAPENERIETEILRENDRQTSDDRIDIAEDSDQIEYEPNYIEDETLTPPYAEDEEVLDILPARPGFLRPAYGDDPDLIWDPVETESTSAAAETEAPVTEETPDISPMAPPAAPATDPKPETTTTKQTTQTKPVTEAEPEINIPEGTNLRAAMVAVAKSQIGVTEKPYNNVKYNTWYYGHEVSDKKGATKYAWCGAFLAWCADQAGVPHSIFPYTASVSGLKNFFSNQGRYYKAKSYTPKPGDIVFFTHSHVGVVVSVADGILTTIEGNASNSVKVNTYKLTNSQLAGYGSPKY